MADGFPIYVQHVVGDVLNRHMVPEPDAPLPASLVEYHERLLRRYGLVDRQEAFTGIHDPETMADVTAARDRLVFDELLRIQVALVQQKRRLELEAVGIRHAVGPTDGVVPGLVSRFIAQLPYALTAAQERAIAQIDEDLAGVHPMHRLLQGDVGAGKTLVAVAALLVSVQGGHQGAFMAPTEVLAEQHATGVRSMLEGFSISDESSLFGERQLDVALLTNRTPAGERRRILAGLADGAVDVVIGTHALLADRVGFHSLGVVVIDEQHRFGVEQRAALRAANTDGPDRGDDRVRRPRRVRAR